HICLGKRTIGIHACDPQLLEPVASRFADLDMAHLVRRAPQIGRHPIAHLASRAKNRNFLHAPVSSINIPIDYRPALAECPFIQSKSTVRLLALKRLPAP